MHALRNRRKIRAGLIHISLFAGTGGRHHRAKWSFGRLLVGYAYAEGWAHCTKEMIFDASVEGATPIPLVRGQMLGGKAEAKLWQAPVATPATPTMN